MFRLNFFPKEINNKKWDSHSIHRQFKFASITLFCLITGVTLTSFISFYLVRHKTESAMVKVVELQQLVFEMNRILEETNQLEQGFFQEILTFGVERSRQNHLKDHDKNVAQIQDISDQIKQLVRDEKLSQRLHKSHGELLAYDQTIEQYHQEFQQANTFAEDLGSQNIGIITKNQEIFQRLHESLQDSFNLEIMTVYHDLIASQQAYFLTRQSLEKQKLNLIINQLKSKIEQEQYLRFYQKEQAQEYLEMAQSNLKKITVLEEKISEISVQFQQDSDTISQQLLTLSHEEVELARQDIKITSQQMTVILTSAIIAMVTLSTVIWHSFQLALKQLAVEQEKSERLLLNILPEPIANRLKYQPGTIAENFEEVTVLFADIAGFTKLSTQVSPSELVNLLNEIFSAFDQISTQKNLEKN
jgi:adenylate cyclase